MKTLPVSLNRSFDKGFTLIEILVVVLIVSIMSGIAVTQLPGFVQRGDFDLESRRLKTLLDMAREEALVQATEYGFKPVKEGYAFYQFDLANIANQRNLFQIVITKSIFNHTIL